MPLLALTQPIKWYHHIIHNENINGPNTWPDWRVSWKISILRVSKHKKKTQKIVNFRKQGVVFPSKMHAPFFFNKLFSMAFLKWSGWFNLINSSSSQATHAYRQASTQMGVTWPRWTVTRWPRGWTPEVKKSRFSYCWWQPEIRQTHSPVEVGSWNPIIYRFCTSLVVEILLFCRFLAPSQVVVWDFWTVNSITSIHFKRAWICRIVGRIHFAVDNHCCDEAINTCMEGLEGNGWPKGRI